MAQIFSTLFFSLALGGALLAVVTMLRRDWARVRLILTGDGVRYAVAAAPRVRVRARTWTDLPRPARAPRAAAA